MAVDPKNRPGSAGFDVFDLDKEVIVIDERVVAVEESGGGSAFPPIAAKGDWNPQDAVAGCSYVFTCGCGAGRQLNLPDPPTDGDEVGFKQTCGAAAPQISGGTTNIQRPQCANLATSHLFNSGGGIAFVLRYSSAVDLWELVMGDNF